MNNAEIAKQLRDLKRANTNTMVVAGFLLLSSIGQRVMLGELSTEIAKGVVPPQAEPFIEGTAEEIR